MTTETELRNEGWKCNYDFQLTLSSVLEIIRVYHKGSKNETATPNLKVKYLFVSAESL